MKKTIFLLTCILVIAIACKKNKTNQEKETVKGNLKIAIVTANGITYKLFTNKDASTFKGILIMGSGNDENNPSEGALDGAAEAAICEKAANNLYAAAIVQYRKPSANTDWNERAKMIGEDYDKCITDISIKYNVDKAKSVVGGFSYAGYLLLTNIAYNETLKYCKGLLAACSSTDIDKISKFKIPVLSLTGKNEFEAYKDPNNPQNNTYVGVGLYNKIPANSPIKLKSEGFNDPYSEGHCGGNWTDKMYSKMVTWLQ